MGKRIKDVIKGMTIQDIRGEIKRVDKTIVAKKSQSRNNIFQKEKEQTITELRTLNQELSLLKQGLKARHREVKRK